MSSLWFGSALLPQGWMQNVRVNIDGGLISRVETGATAQPGDERHAAAIPGLPNLHSHAFQRGMAGLGEVRGPTGDSFWTWREVMYRFLDRMDPDDMQAIAEQAYVEMLESGFTRVGEFHYVHHDRDGRPYANLGELAGRIAAAADETGIALTLLPVFYAHGGFGGAAAGHGQRRFINDVDRFGRLMEASRGAIAPLSDAVLGLAPHSLRAATSDEIAAIVPMTEGPLHIHVAEQTKEVDDCLAWCGKRPVEQLYAIADIGSRWCLIHATHVTAAETAQMAASGAVVGLCPITEANLGDGVFPAQDFTVAGGALGVGSDSNVLIDAAEELRVLEYGQRLWHRARNVLAGQEGAATGQVLFDAAFRGGCQALGVKGGLAVGCAADIVSLDISHPALSERTEAALMNGWIFACRGGGAVDSVWRRGQKLVEGGRHRARERVAARFKVALSNVLG